jgi:type VI secretion system protein ImpF
MRSPDKQRENFQIPLMYAFRDAFEKGDARKKEDVRVDGERVVSTRGSMRRRSVDEQLLKRDLAIDLTALLSTVDLASVVDLDGLDYVQKSILNYGLYDLTHITTGSSAVASLRDSLKSTLLQHEPRLSADTLGVERVEADKDHDDQRVRFTVAADMICRPLDVPIEFVAELDVGDAKVIMPQLLG